MAAKLIIAAGMPRAGSGWHYNLTHDLVVASGGQNARQIRDKYSLKTILTEVNCNIGVLSARRLLVAMLPVIFGNTYTIKTHAQPSTIFKLFHRVKLLQATYIYRDPRDALLSAYEYGKRMADDGRPNYFSQLSTIEEAITFMKEYVLIADGWLAAKNVHHVKYEDLKMNYSAEADKLISSIPFLVNSPETKAVLEKYQPEQTNREDRGMHFVKGISGRYAGELTEEQQTTCIDLFGQFIKRHDYPLP